MTKTGAFAPMTETGSIVVNGFVASCFAIVRKHWLAHWAMTPFRAYYPGFKHLVWAVMELPSRFMAEFVEGVPLTTDLFIG